MSSTFGNHLKLALFGQSHGPAIGITLDGFPAGMKIDMEALAAQMARRAPGNSAFATPRKEADLPKILSGVFEGRTTGQPLCAIIENTNTRSQDYGERMDLPRPGHGDYTGHVRYYGFEDFRGGGHFSGRLTAPIVFAGALCRQWLEQKGVKFYGHILRLGGAEDVSLEKQLPGDDFYALPLPVLNAAARDQMAAAITDARSRGDSIGGVMEGMITGVPAGLGAPFFDSVESVLSHLFFAIPAIKGVEFGLGFEAAQYPGSFVNDPLRMEGDKVINETNHAGGILGGITNGMPITFRLAVKPTPSIAQAQKTVSLAKGENAELAVRGRHDPCILPRAVPVMEAMAAIGLMELWKERQST